MSPQARPAPQRIYREATKETLIVLWEADGIAEGRFDLYCPSCWKPWSDMDIYS